MIAAQGRSLGDYIEVLKRRRVSFAIGVLLALILGAGYLVVAERTYLSSAKVLVRGAPTDSIAENSRTTDDVNLDTEAQVVTSLPVAELAEDQLSSGLTLPSLTERVTVTVPPNSTVLQISYQAFDQSEAQAGAQAFASAYLDNRSQTAQEALDAQISRLRSELDLASSELTDVAAELQGVEATFEERAALRGQRALLNTRLVALNTRLAALQSLFAPSGDIINNAQRPTAPRTPNPELVLPAALFAGLLLGLALALWRESRDPRLHSAAEVSRVLGVTPLAELAVTTDLIGERRVRSFDVRAVYHALRAGSETDGDVVTVFSPGAVEAGDVVSRALAETAAHSGTRALLLSAGAGERSTYRRARGELAVASYASLDDQSEGGLDAGRLRGVIERLRENYDFAVLIPPSADTVADLPLVSRFVDAVVMVVHLGVATLPSVTDSLRVLNATVDTRVVLVTVPKTSQRRQRSRWFPGNSPPSDPWNYEQTIDASLDPSDRVHPGHSPRSHGSPQSPAARS